MKTMDPLDFYRVKEKVRLLSFLSQQAYHLNNLEFSEKCLEESNRIIRGTFGWERDRLEEVSADAEDEAMAPFRVEKF